MKTCYVCGETKELSEYYRHSKRKDKRQTHCKPCYKELQTGWYYKRKYGITVEERDNLLLKQKGRCAICEIEVEFCKKGNNIGSNAVIDHCHSTGTIRGVLCGSCNTGLGSFKDNPTSLTKAVEYLK